MSNYSKLIGSLIGGVVGMLAAFGIDLSGVMTAEVQSAIATVLGSLIGTFIAPKNVEA